MIDDMEAVKGWYEETFESGMDEELLKANLIFFKNGMLQNTD